MKKALSLALTVLLVFPMLSILQIVPVLAATDEYFIYSKFDPSGISDVTGVGGYVEYYGVPEWGDEIQYVYFLSGYTGYKVKVTVTDGDGDGKIEPRQHPSHYLSEFQGPIEPRHFEIVSSANLAGYTSGSGGHTEEFYVDSGGVYLGAYPNGIHKWDHDWKYLGKIANSAPTRTESMAYNPAENVWYAGGRARTIYQLSDTDNDGSFLDESWTAIFTYPSYGGSHHDGMEYVGGYLWISDMTSDVIGKWEYDTATSAWKELKRFTYTEPASVEGMGFGPNDHFWCGSGWGSGSYIYELGNEITKGYPIANAGPDIDAYPPTIPLRFYAGGSHHTDPAKHIVLYEWDFESDGAWDYSFGSFVYPTGKAEPYTYAGWLAGGPGMPPYQEGYYHLGQDMEADEGDNIYAIADGEIVYVSVSGWGAGNFGLLIKHKLNTGEDFLALYGHVRPNSEDLQPAVSGPVDPPVPVAAGEAFATIGPYGSIPHLHFGIRPGGEVPPSPWGRMGLDQWSDTNGFVDPLDWITTRTPLNPVPLYVEHAHPAYYNPDGSIDWDKTAKDYAAILRVTDDSDPPLQDMDTCIVHITRPPWKPVADPNGPYEGSAGSTVQLDGSNSYDPESRMFPSDHPWYETIATYEWDLDNDGEFDDATGAKPTHTWNSEGLYTIGLKVTDSQPSGPGGTFGPLDSDTKHTTVVISKVLARVTVTIVEVRAIDSMDPLGGDADFYAKVSIDGQILPTSSTINDRDDIYPESDPQPWIFSRMVSKAIVPIRIEIWDNDLIFDDHVDIDKDSNDRDLELSFDVTTQSLSGDVTYGYSRGAGDSNRAEIWFNVGLDTGDKDGDGLFDSWETTGIHMDDDGNVDLNLPGLGATPDHKDIFIELDYMENSTHSHKPKDGVIQNVTDAFANAPVSNLDGTTGISLHINVNDSLQLRNVLGTWIYLLGRIIGYDWSEFDTIKTDNFDSNRRFVFHYCLFAHRIGAATSTVSGISEWPGPGNDFIVSLGGWPTDGVGSEMQQAGTLMHELGHNLNLQHGGDDDINFKPNYLSIMNYVFQSDGIPPSGSLDYSRIALATLNESNLDERIGIQDGAYNTYYYLSSLLTANAAAGQRIVNVGDGTRFTVGDRVRIESSTAIENNIIASISGNQLTMQNNLRNTYTVIGGSRVRTRSTGVGLGPIDWNRNGRIEQGIRISINDGPCWGEKGPREHMNLTSYNDWEHVSHVENLNFRLSDTVYGGVHGAGFLKEIDLTTSMALKEMGSTIEKFAEGPAAVLLYTEESWNFTYVVTNVYDYEIYNLTVKDHFGANLDVAFISSTKGTYTQYTNKPGRQQRFTWTIESLAPLETVILKLEVSTGLNPAKKQEFTEAGLRVLNSGATVKWVNSSGHQGSDESGQVSIWAGVSVSDTTGAIAGYVTNAITGEPLRGYVIELRDSAGILVATTTTDKNGFYALSSLAPTDYTIICSTQSYTATVTAEQVKRIDFEFD